MCGTGRLLRGLLLFCASLPGLARTENLDDGCGHFVQGPESGVLASKHYPGTYPNNSWCEKKIRVPGAGGVTLRFGDLDIEGRDCESSYVKVLTASYGSGRVYGTYCGRLQSSPRLLKTLHVDSGEITVRFRSGAHISGRGFLLAYAAGDRKDLLTCLDKGNHFSDGKYRKYCPAGCRDVPGEVSGDISHGYRHTSVLCKAAVHAGIFRDETGGPITVENKRRWNTYPAVRANGVQSEFGSLSDQLVAFVTNDCRKPLHPVGRTASSWQRGGEAGRSSDWSPNGTDPAEAAPVLWAADHSGNVSRQWLELDLGETRQITGISTAGFPSSNSYVKKYRVERGAQNGSSEFTIFEGNVDSQHQTHNTFNPPMVTRFLRIVPLEWKRNIAMKVELLGCAHVARSLSPVLPNRANASSHITMETLPTKPKPSGGNEEPLIISHTDIVHLVIIVVPTVLTVLLLLLGICICSVLKKKKVKENSYGSSEAQQTGCWKQIKQPFGRHQSTEFTISYSSEKEPIQKLDLVTSNMAEYQQPLIGTGTVTRKGSTFKPIDADGKDDPSAPSSHYDFLHTANQYALPLTNQEPEYATPIVERHTFRKEGFLPDPSYSVPGVVLSKNPSFKAAATQSGGYQTPQVKSDRPKHPEGIYDSPKIHRPAAQNGAGSEYQRPQGKSPAPESYSTPRDCLKLRPAASQRPDQEGSSDGSLQSTT
ncbi:discoidin, CUB and LCCL domain-containing protein 1 isoform X2 [Denticeps clupeoides]|uniref:discoidin, CUB and LCCL domain-containing protein 1 isoform X2 n=1 Tax=Denticeps clupeoides TaxID=299321 RepID=UPI0010A50491|nr:discoidin, CUB and LCCL domain-containing protein 1 isoform X2 [Denticeps clupeoides]